MKFISIVSLLTVTACGVAPAPTLSVQTNTAGAPRTLHTFGDSITAGYTSPQPAAPWHGYTAILCESLGWTLDNFGVPASHFVDNVEFGAIMNLTVGSDTVSLIQVGYNDVRDFGLDQAHFDLFKQDLAQALIHLTSNGAVVFVGNTLRGGGADPANTEAYNQAINDIVNAAANPRAVLVDVASLYDPTIYDGPDELHPSHEGHVRLAQIYQQAIEAYFARK